MFQIKDFRSIAASMINWCKAVTDKITDFSVGSVARTLMEAAAAELDELYQQMLIGLKEAIPVATYTSFGFDLLTAAAASGIVRFSSGSPAASNITIPAGTVVRVPSTTTTFATAVDATLLAGNTTVDVLVTAQNPGIAGNVGAGTVTELATPITGIATVTNPAPFLNGRDAETEDQRKTRFQQYIATLARGTKDALIYGAKTAQVVDGSGVVSEYAAYAAVVEPWLTDSAQPVALVNLYVHNGASATSASLVAKVQQAVDGYYLDDGTPVPGWKAAGVKVVAIAATDKVVNVTGVITLLSGYDGPTVRTAAANAIKAYIQGLGIGAKVILAEIIAIVKRDVEGVYNVSFTVPSGDVTCAVSEKAIPGTVTLT
jgi:uncharacterized phage protein gp47/JayE